MFFVGLLVSFAPVILLRWPLDKYVCELPETLDVKSNGAVVR